MYITWDRMLTYVYKREDTSEITNYAPVYKSIQDFNFNV